MDEDILVPDYNRVIKCYLMDPKAEGAKPMLNKAVKEFQRLVDPVKDMGTDEHLKALFAEWIIWDFEPEPGVKLMQRYIDENPDHIDAFSLIHMKNALKTNFSSLFWVRGISPLSHGVYLVEARTGKEFVVYGNSMFMSLIDPSGLTSLRLAEVNGKWTFPGTPIFYQPMAITDEMQQQSIVEGDEKRPSFIELVKMAHGRAGMKMEHVVPDAEPEEPEPEEE